MIDRFGRKIEYLRISLTDLCNLRCVYCMPEDGVCKLPHDRILSLEEVEEIAAAAVELASWTWCISSGVCRDCGN